MRRKEHINFNHCLNNMHENIELPKSAFQFPEHLRCLLIGNKRVEMSL